MNEEEKIFAGKLFDASVPELRGIKHKTHALCQKYNDLDEDDKERAAIIKEFIGSIGKRYFMRGPIRFNYGKHTFIGDNFGANFNLTVMDDGKIFIGNNVMFGPNVSLLATSHPLIAEERVSCRFPDGHVGVSEYAEEIHIDDNVWIASSAVVLGGVHIGEGAVIGAGSIVTKDIPAHHLAYGNPCRPIRLITEKDSKLELMKY